MNRLRFLFLLSASLLSFQVITTINGKTVGITDGDTVKLLKADYTEIKVRLEGIDCPEKNQAFGQKANRFQYAWIMALSLLVISLKSFVKVRVLPFNLLNLESLCKMDMLNASIEHLGRMCWMHICSAA